MIDHWKSFVDIYTARNTETIEIETVAKNEERSFEKKTESRKNFLTTTIL